MKQKTDVEIQHRFGKMVTGKHPLLLEKSQLSDSQNMMPGYEWEQRKGMAALTAAAVATGLRWKSMTQFRDLRGDTDVILAHTYDSVGGEDLYQGSALPPNAITWSKKYDLTASCEKCQFANVAKALLISNDKDFLIWRGTVHFPTGVWKYTNGNAAYTLFADELFDGDSSTTMVLDSLTTSDKVYVLSEMPLDTITWVLPYLNVNGAAVTVKKFNGSWVGLTVADGTSTASSSMDDDFTGDNDDPLDTELWTVSGDSEPLIQNNKSNHVYGAGAHNATALANNLIAAGDFEITVDYDLVTYPATSSWRHQLRFEIDSDNWVTIHRSFTGSYSHAYLNESEIGGTPQSTKDEATADTSGKLRLTRSGDTVKAWYWDGAWNEMGSGGFAIGTGAGTVELANYNWVGNPAVEANFDNFTLVSGTIQDISLGQNGSMTWTKATDEVQTEVQGVPGFAYEISWNATLDSEVEVSEITVHSPMAPVRNVWDGVTEPPMGCYVYDGTDHTDYFAYVNNVVEGQYMDLSGVTTTDKIYVGFAQRVNKIIFYPAADGKNTGNVSVAVNGIKYHNAAGAATTVGSFTDTMETNNATFSQKGYLSWADPGWQNEKMTIIGGDDIPMYWYEIVVDAALDDPTYIYFIKGIPIPKDPDPSRGCFAFKRRAWQIAPRNKENMVRYSAADLPNVWNGRDSGYIAFGERPLRVAGAFYNETVLFADNEIWMLQGNAPTNFGRLRLSAKVGISSPESLVQVESGVIVSDVVKVVLAWQFFDGFWMFDGVRIWKISSPDIDSFFDPDHDDYINPAYLDQTVGEYDYPSQTVRWAVYSGSGATTPTKMVVMHFPSLEFGIFDYATDIDAMLSVINNKYYLVGGGHADGRFYQLDSGVTDLVTGTATAVDAYVITADQFIEYSDGLRQRLTSIWSEAQAAGGQIELDEYPDGSETPVNIAKQSMTVTGKIFGAIRRTLKFIPGQKTAKFRIRNRSKNARMKLLGYSTTVDKGRSNE